MHFDEYELWVEQFLMESLTDDSGNEYITKEIAEHNNRVFNKLIQQHAENEEYTSLCSLAEYLRAYGFFDDDDADKQGILLSSLLRQAIAVFDNKIVFKDNYILWLPCSVYDIIFHQIRFDEYPPVCFDLYFELTKRVLNDEFMPLFKIGNVKSYYYQQCLYFIHMADNTFKQRPAKFMVIWPLIEKQIKKDKELAWMGEYWRKAYAELTAENKQQ